MTTIQFYNPAILLGWIPLVFLAGWMLFRRSSRPLAHPNWHPWLALWCLFLIVLAGARPQLGKVTSERAVRRGNIVFMIDTSRSMMAEDLPPSRLEFTKVFIRRMMERLGGARVALFPFTEFGFLQMPLTADLSAAEDFLTALGPSNSSSQGTDFSRSLESLLTTLDELEQRVRESGQAWANPRIVLFSDGETHRSLDNSVLANVAKRGITIFTVGVGTKEGGPIPVEGRFGMGRDFFRDSGGRTVRTKLDTQPLEAIARETGGAYFPPRLDSVVQLTDRLSRDMKYSNARSRFQATNEIFPWILIAALAFLMLELLARGWRTPLQAAVLLLALQGSLGHAESITEPHEKMLNKAGKDRPRTAFNLGVEESKRGNLQESYELFLEATREPTNKVLRKKAFFNLGNTLLQLGDPAQALHAYQAAMDLRTGRFDKEADTRISENIVTASKLHEQMKQAAREREGEQEGEDQKQGKPKDQGGPKGDYVAEKFTDEQKEKIYKLITGSEQQTLQQIQERKNKKGSREENGQQW